MLDKLLAIINEMFEEQGKQRLTQLRGSMHLRDDLHMDSFALAEFTVRVEAELGIDVYEDGIIQTVEEVVHKLERGHNG
jgi:acyl carrier protein